MAQLVVGSMLDRFGPRQVFLTVAVIQIIFFTLMPGLVDGVALLVAFGFMLGAFGQIPINDYMIGKMASGAFRARIYGVRYVVSFTVLATGVRGELGRGGRYITTAGEAATGFSLYLDSIMRALPEPSETRKLYLPFGTPAAEAVQLRSGGWITVAGLAPEAGTRVEAQRLECSHCWHNGEILSLGDRGGDAPAEK